MLVRLPEILGVLNADPLVQSAGLTSARTHGFVPGLPTIDPNVAFTTQSLGRSAAEDWLSGQIPWWNPFEGIGVPLAGEMQSAAFFPPILLLQLPNGVLFFHLFLQIMAGVCTYLLLRRLGVSDLAAVAGGMVFELNGTFAWLANAVVNPIPFLPLLLLGIELAREPSPKSRRIGSLCIALSIPLSLYAGFPETAFIDGLLAAAWSLFRLAQIRGRAILDFLSNVSFGVVAGVLLAAPIVIAFIDYLLQADIGGHAGLFSHVSLPPSAIPQIVTPYVYGSLFEYPGPSLGPIWSNVGGYLGSAVSFFVIIGLLGRRERGLRLLLCAWMAIALTRTFGFTPAVNLVNVIPGISSVAFYRYAPPSWELGAAILAAFAIDDFSLRSRSSVPVVGSALFAACLAVGLPRLLGGESLGEMVGPFAVLWTSASALWAVAVIGAALVVYIRQPERHQTLALCTVAVLDSAVLFVIPTLANPRDAQLGLGGIEFLQQHLGLSRFYTLGPIAPNYGSYFHLASINHNDLPIAANWVRYVREQLDTYLDPVNFTGTAPRSDPSALSQMEELQLHLPGYEWAGVKYVLTPPDEDPAAHIVAGRAQIGNVAAPLTPGDTASGTLPAGSIQPGTVTAIGIMIGNYRGTSDGVLTLRLCIANNCAEGSANTRGSQDNAMFYVSLRSPIDIVDGELSAQYQLSYQGGNNPVALWLWAGQSEQNRSVEVAGHPYLQKEPRIGLHYKSASNNFQRVYSDSVMSIYELPQPSPYFEAIDGNCQLSASSRTDLIATCDGPARLVRRELYFPGWAATVNGASTPISEYGSLFQSILLPVGTSRTQFSYLPPGALAGFACFIVALLAIAAQVLRVRSSK